MSRRWKEETEEAVAAGRQKKLLKVVPRAAADTVRQLKKVFTNTAKNTGIFTSKHCSYDEKMTHLCVSDISTRDAHVSKFFTTRLTCTFLKETAPTFIVAPFPMFSARMCTLFLIINVIITHTSLLFRWDKQLRLCTKIAYLAAKF